MGGWEGLYGRPRNPAWLTAGWVNVAERDGGPHSPPDCVHKGPPIHSTPRSPLRTRWAHSKKPTPVSQAGLLLTMPDRNRDADSRTRMAHGLRNEIIVSKLYSTKRLHEQSRSHC